MAWRVCGHAPAINSRLTSRPLPSLPGPGAARCKRSTRVCLLHLAVHRPPSGGLRLPVCPAPCSHGTRCDFPRRMTTLTMVRYSRVSSPPTEASSKPQAPRTTSARRSAPFSRRWLPRQRPFSCTVRREKIVSNPPSPLFWNPIGPSRDVERTSPPRPSALLFSSSSSPTTLNVVHPQQAHPLTSCPFKRHRRPHRPDPLPPRRGRRHHRRRLPPHRARSRRRQGRHRDEAGRGTAPRRRPRQGREDGDCFVSAPARAAMGQVSPPVWAVKIRC